ncbi:septum formation inhibitor Maf [Pigmentiphaga aceris]|uniref:7-methyl-GTP pyrophosphatase n=1 Tax=Pigmentiphaga aceris TaxID=1940612 RepID=A0A5C0AZ47_9BURK|nr:Maf family protein [Pigmentiphaga aceris]QEI06956.1 septum formation inhibitor Maf [Pigmentiphaga aceris]
MPLQTPARPLILASTSVYRRELLGRLKLPFEVVSPEVDETPLAGETPVALAMRLARAKARAGVQLRPGAVVIGADQVATLDATRIPAPSGALSQPADEIPFHPTVRDLIGQPIGKPGTFEAALAQLQSMRGHTVSFHSALAVDDGERVESIDVVTRATFRDLPDSALIAYLQAEAVLDTAGSAKAEGLGIALMSRIDSDDPTALIGLPLIALTRMLANFGIDPLLSLAAHRHDTH